MRYCAETNVNCRNRALLGLRGARDCLPTLAGLEPGFSVRALAFLLLSAVVLISGCAGRGGRVPPPFYGTPLIDMSRLDASCLKGRRIVLDPGHGGAFSGAIGWGGLEEDDVNLGVALYLWGLLRDAGAQVFLTRSSDRDFLLDPAGSLRDDLRERMETASAFEPELFISLHHNADMSRSRNKNQIETYFKMLDEGPSRDAASLIHDHLKENLAISEGQVVAGNYFVLRNAPCRAVLGEPSYLTNPWVEKKLELAQKQLLEAQAYFAGIVEYFSRGTPSVISVTPCDTVVCEARPALSASISTEGTGIDTVSVVCRLDNRTLPTVVNAEETLLAAAVDRPLASGTHELCFSFRNLNGNSSGETCCRFHVSLPASSLLVEICPGGLHEKGGLLLSAQALDANGNAVKDGTPVLFTSSDGSFSENSVGTSSGVASTVFFPLPSVSQARIDVICENVRDSMFVRPISAGTRVLRIVAADNGEALASARVSLEDSVVSRSTPQGLVAFEAGAGDSLLLEKSGYLPVSLSSLPSPSPFGADAVDTLDMAPVALGFVRNRRIAVDIGGATPKGGKATPHGGTRSRVFSRRYGAVRTSDVSPAEASAAKAPLRGPNAAVSAEIGKRLARMLVGAGAEVLVLDDTMPDAEKVKRAELFAAERYLRVEVGAKKSSLLHYPGSSGGNRLAQECSRWWSETLPIRSPAVREDAHYVLRHTSCSALVLRLASVPEKLCNELSARIAYTLYLATIQDFGLPESDLSRLHASCDELDRSEKASVLLDEFLSLPLSKDGTVSFFCAEGRHSLRIISDRKKGMLEFITLRKGERTKHELMLD